MAREPSDFGKPVNIEHEFSQKPPLERLEATRQLVTDYHRASAVVRIFGNPPPPEKELKQHEDAIRLMSYVEAVKAFEYDVKLKRTIAKYPTKRQNLIKELKLREAGEQMGAKITFLEVATPFALKKWGDESRDVQSSGLELFMNDFLLTPGGVERLTSAVEKLDKVDPEITNDIVHIIDQARIRFRKSSGPPIDSRIVADKPFQVGIFAPIDQQEAYGPLQDIVGIAAADKPGEIIPQSPEISIALHKLSLTVVEYHWEHAKDIYSKSSISHMMIMYDLLCASLSGSDVNSVRYEWMKNWIAERIPASMDSLSGELAQLSGIASTEIIGIQVALSRVLNVVIPNTSEIESFWNSNEIWEKVKEVDFNEFLQINKNLTPVAFVLTHMITRFLAGETSEEFRQLTKELAEAFKSTRNYEHLRIMLTERVIFIMQAICTAHHIPFLLTLEESSRLYKESDEGESDRARSLIAFYERIMIEDKERQRVKFFPTQIGLLTAIFQDRIPSTVDDTAEFYLKTWPLLYAVTDRYTYFVARGGDRYPANENPHLPLRELNINEMTFFPIKGISGGYEIILDLNTDVYQLGTIHLEITPESGLRLIDYPDREIPQGLRMAILNLILPPLDSIVTEEEVIETPGGDTGRLKRSKRKGGGRRPQWITLGGPLDTRNITLQSRDARLHAEAVKKEYGLDTDDENSRRRRKKILKDGEFVTYYRGFIGEKPVTNRYIPRKKKQE